ncbi:uncharacterized protein LOC144709254 [Wolffia australiana]
MNGYGAVWSTREDLLLVCAAKLHGTKNWRLVATEIQPRIEPPAIVDPQTCERRFLALRRRFKPENREIDGGDDCALLLEELRKLRVAELRREVESHDESITSLQRKVKKLEEDRDRDEEQIDAAEFQPRDEAIDGCDPSFDDSNSSEAKNGGIKIETGEEDNKSGGESAGEEVDSAVQHQQPESGESVAETRGEAAAVLSRKLHVESQPLISFLEIFRSHKHASLFEHRLKIQETARYRSLIRRHVDLGGVTGKLTGGGYVARAEFFRDLLLLCTNAAVFFPRTSTEYAAAVELRRVVRRRIGGGGSSPSISDPTAGSGGPLLACRKRAEEERADPKRTKRRRSSRGRGGARADPSSARASGGGALLEALKNSRKEIPVKRGVGRPPKRPPPPPKARARKK